MFLLVNLHPVTYLFISPGSVTVHPLGHGLVPDYLFMLCPYLVLESLTPRGISGVLDTPLKLLLLIGQKANELFK